MFTIDLTNQTALITGAAQGLGLATATALHAAGANVVINYWPDPAGLEKARAEKAVAALSGSAGASPSQAGPRVMIHGADVRDQAAVNAMFEDARAKFGSLDILVNNAGILRDKTLKKITEQEWQDVLDTNLSGVFHCCKAAAERLNDGGRIVNLASISAVLGTFGQANYAAAKAGVIGLTKVVSRELAKRRITVNAVAPGVVLTEMGKSIPEESRAAMLPLIPLARFGEPREIADVILFLCSHMASYMTGQTLHVNGGWWG
jgi:3-oxoacyl-[acyl-carrier protein] reductase